MRKMNKIFDCIISIPKDKLLHVLAGIFITLVVLRVSRVFVIDNFTAKIIALLITIIIGFLREYRQKKQGGIFDIKDFIATLLGSMIVLILYA